MSKATPVFVIGSFVAACSAKVAYLPEPGETLRADSFLLEAGGKGFNCAVALHRLDVPVDGLFAIGRDPLGDFAMTAFDEAGLSDRMLIRLDHPTGAGIGFIDTAGENCIAVFPGANDKLPGCAVEAAADRIAASRHVLACFEAGDEAIAAAFAIARRGAATTVLNPSPYRTIRPEILDRTRLIVANRVEARALCTDLGAAADDGWQGLAEHLFARGIEMLVVTAGAGGATLLAPDRASVFQPAFPADCIDTIGAGDAFVSGLVASLSRGRSAEESLRAASACGALATTRHGVLPALPTISRLADFLATA